MPRPYAPTAISPLPVAEPFSIGDQEKSDLARALNLASLPSALCDAISQAIGCYRITAAGSGDTTVANVLVALDELSKSGHAYDKAINRLANSLTLSPRAWRQRYACLVSASGSHRNLQLHGAQRVGPPHKLIAGFSACVAPVLTIILRGLRSTPSAKSQSSASYLPRTSIRRQGANGSRHNAVDGERDRAQKADVPA